MDTNPFRTAVILWILLTTVIYITNVFTTESLSTAFWATIVITNVYAVAGILWNKINNLEK